MRKTTRYFRMRLDSVYFLKLMHFPANNLTKFYLYYYLVKLKNTTQIVIFVGLELRRIITKNEN